MTNPDTHNCPICDEPFKPEDNCATDIELGTCHFDCLDGSPVVDLDTGEELPDEDMHSFPYSEVMDPPAKNRPVAKIVGAAMNLEAATGNPAFTGEYLDGPRLPQGTLLYTAPPANPRSEAK